MTDDLSKLFINLSKRAEKTNQQALIASFVDVGPLSTVLTTIDNQILYGRRGTGKTHALAYVSGLVRDKGDIPVYADLRKIGSTGGLYSDGTIPLAERATRLLIDVLTALHAALLEAVLDDSYFMDLAVVGPLLDNLADAITEVTVTGPIREELASEAETKEAAKTKFGLGISAKGLEASVASGADSAASLKEARKITREGNVEHRVHFGRLGAALQKLADAIDGKRIWLLLDEWSVVPLDLQPYLADLLRRAVFPANSITVKIGAIERRSRFLIQLKNTDYIGI